MSSTRGCSTTVAGTLQLKNGLHNVDPEVNSYLKNGRSLKILKLESFLNKKKMIAFVVFVSYFKQLLTSLSITFIHLNN